MSIELIRPEFVEAVPEHLEEGLLYISIRFRTAAHLCACGCGSRIVTPIKPAKWSLTYDGESISLWPSVGNWQKRCRSHYIIKNGKVNWAGAWTEREIAAGRARDRAALRNYYSEVTVEDPESAVTPSREKGRWFRRQLSKIAALMRRR